MDKRLTLVLMVFPLTLGSLRFSSSDEVTQIVTDSGLVSESVGPVSSKASDKTFWDGGFRVPTGKKFSQAPTETGTSTASDVIKEIMEQSIITADTTDTGVGQLVSPTLTQPFDTSGGPITPFVLIDDGGSLPSIIIPGGGGGSPGGGGNGGGFGGGSSGTSPSVPDTGSTVLMLVLALGGVLIGHRKVRG